MQNVEFVRAIFPFQATQSGDLSFEEDEIITVLEKNNNGWWSGQIGTRQGDFPFNYVEPISQEEVARLMQSRYGNVGAQMQGDRVQNVEVIPEKKVLRFKIRASLNTGSTIEGIKSMAHFRTLDSTLRAISRTFDGILPPMWADNAYFNEESSYRRGRILESYLRKCTTDETLEYAFVSWLNPKARYKTTNQIKGQVTQGQADASAVSRRSVATAIGAAPPLARVEYNWTPHDAVELELRKGEVIAVLSRQTLSPGWWEGQTAEGLKGLFPYNHVEALDDQAAAALVLGNYREAREPAQPKQSAAAKGKRQRKQENNFAVGSMESFDALLNDGFTMEKGGKLVTEDHSNTPGQGDHCVMAYVGYVWDCQTQRIVEFASSDLPDKDGKISKLQFTIGNNEVIKGIELAASFMEKGESVRLIVKPELAYGDVGFPQLNIPPNVHLVYDITLESFETGLPGPPQATRKEVGMPTGVPKTLAEAVALRAKRELQMNEQTFAPIPNREGRGHGNQVRGYKQHGDAGGRSNANKPNFANAPKAKKKGAGAPRRYNLNQMKEIVRKKTFEEHGVEAAFLEESLTDEAFYEAFSCDRSAFILFPRWKQMKMRKEAGLY